MQHSFVKRIHFATYRIYVFNTKTEIASFSYCTFHFKSPWFHLHTPRSISYNKHILKIILICYSKFINFVFLFKYFTMISYYRILHVVYTTMWVQLNWIANFTFLQMCNLVQLFILYDEIGVVKLALV